MTIDMRLFGAGLNLILFILCFVRLHRIDIRSPAFVLYLSLTMGWGWLLLGDLSFFFDWIDLGVVGLVGPGYRFIGFRVLVLMGLIYVSIAGPCRKGD